MAECTIPQIPRSSQPSEIRIADGKAIVVLKHGLEATVDISDLALISGRRWLILTTPSGHAYAYTRTKEVPVLLMHRFLLGASVGQYVDHANGDGLDNRRSNIRICNPTQNQANRAVERRNLIGMKGVSKDKGKNFFRAYITPNGRKIHLGCFKTKEEAHAAYLGAARILWGEFASS